MIFASTPPINDDPAPNIDKATGRRVASGKPVPGCEWSPRPEFDRPRAHEANPILLAMRIAIEQGATARDLLDDINGYQTGYPGANAVIDAFELRFQQATLEQWREERIHARRVLTRLAKFQ